MDLQIFDNLELLFWAVGKDWDELDIFWREVDASFFNYQNDSYHEYWQASFYRSSQIEYVNKFMIQYDYKIMNDHEEIIDEEE